MILNHIKMTELISCLLTIGIVFCTTPVTALFNGDEVKDDRPAPFSEQLEVPTDVGVGNLSNSFETTTKGLLFGIDDIGKGFASGTGTEQDPYVIETSNQLRTFARSLSDKFDYTDKFVILNRDIDISDSNWFPVGGSRFAFNGTFNGCGHTISGLKEGGSESPLALGSGNVYIGLFGVLNKDAAIKNLNIAKVEIYTTSMSTTYVGGIAGAAQGNTRKDLYTGVLIDNCNVTGTIFLASESGNNYVGGLIGRQYKGEIVNSSTNVNIRCVVRTGNYTAGAGGLVGLNNRGLIANCYSISNVYGSGCRRDGAEGMASIGNLVGVQSGTLVGCCASGSTKTAEYSVCVGTVSGWITGTGSTYSCWYDEDSNMTVDNYVVNPVESVGTLVPSGVNEEGEVYTGGVISDIHGYTKDTYTSIASELNSRFASYPVDIASIYKLGNSSLKTWTVKAGVVTLGESYGNIRYVKPQEKKNSESIAVPKDGIWYGSSKAGNYIVKIIVRDGRVIGEPEVIEDNISVDDRVRNGYVDSVKKEAIESAVNKAIYGDHTDYSRGDSTKFAGGNGTESDPYKIANEEQLRYLASSINCCESWEGKWFALTANITLSDKEWLPIGWSAQKEVRGKARVVAAYPFKGNFDGRNYTIRGLRIGTATSPADTYVTGLFGLTEGEYNSNDSLLNFKTTGKRAIVLRNIHLQDVSIYNKTRYESYSGGLLGCGQNGVFIDNCSVTGTISSVTAESFSRAAGLSTSIFRGAVTNCWTNVEVYAETDVSGAYAGGMFATTNRATIFNCYALGNVTGKSTSNNKVHIGGFCGQDGGIQVNCYASGNVVSLKTTTDIGGLNGRSCDIAVSVNCYYNKEAIQSVAGTKIEGVAAGFSKTALTEIVGKTSGEITSSDFVKLLNNNISAGVLGATIEKVNTHLAQVVSNNGFNHCNYYDGTELLVWSLHDKIVGF